MKLSTILNKKTIPYFIIGGLLIYLFMTNGSEDVKIEIPSKENVFFVENPVPEVRVDTVFKKVLIKGEEVVKTELVTVANPVNQNLFKRYKEALRLNDSIQQVNLYKEAVTERKYNERFEDSVQVITVKSEVVGLLKSQSIEYKTKPKIIDFKCEKTRPSLYLGGFAGSSVAGIDPFFGVQLNLVNKKRVLTVGFDNKKQIQVGVSLKLF